MQIVALEVRQVRIRLKRPIKHASFARTETDNIVVRCTLSDGSIGTGEGVPREYVTGETIDFAIDHLKQSSLADQFTACPNFASAVHMAERLRLPDVPGDDRMCQGNAARCALELAILDAYGRAFGEPLMSVTKIIAPELYEPRESVQYSGIILTGKVWKARLIASYYWLMGFHQVKVKVGVAEHDDGARLARIRRSLGSTIDIRLDANEAWTPSETIDRIRALESYGISCIEQPVPHEAVHELAEIRKHIHTPIMLDESLCSEVDAERAIRGNWCQFFNLRLSKCGGFIPTLKLAALATRHGIGYQLGCQVGETGILSAAGRQFATSVKGIRYLEGSYDKHLVKNDLIREDITFRRSGWAPMLANCGLSVAIDTDELEQVTVRREVLIG